jgi:prepilin-type N-terminal cleavage/methylation domain-containing protein
MRTADRGFTLVELLVVISVLVLLAGMAVPVLSGVLAEAKKTATRGQMNSIRLALTAYDDRFGGYPPSDPNQVAKCSDGSSTIGGGYANTGAEALCFFIRGWYIDSGKVIRGVKYQIKNVTGNWDEVKPFYTPDENEQFASGHSRYGFGGAQYGQFFGDRFDDHRPILYFKASGSGSNPFRQDHNAEAINKWKPSGARDFDSFVIRNGIARSNDFMLWSAGPDYLFFTKDDMIFP